MLVDNARRRKSCIIAFRPAMTSLHLLVAEVPATLIPYVRWLCDRCGVVIVKTEGVGFIHVIGIFSTQTNSQCGEMALGERHCGL